MIKAYLEYSEKVKNLSNRTVNEYRKELRGWKEWLEHRGLSLKEVTKSTVDAFVMDEHERGMKPETIKKRVTAIRSFYQWTKREGITTENPARWCQSPKSERPMPKVASVAALDEYLRQPVETERAERVHLLVAILLETGVRLSEALGIRWYDIDTELQRIKVYGKGRKERFVYYGNRTKRELSMTQVISPYVLNFTGERELRRELSDEVSEYVEGIHPHMLRHTFATALLNKGCPLKDVSELMGHAHVATTERYTHVAHQHISEQYKQYLF